MRKRLLCFLGAIVSVTALAMEPGASSDEFLKCSRLQDLHRPGNPIEVTCYNYNFSAFCPNPYNQELSREALEAKLKIKFMWEDKYKISEQDFRDRANWVSNDDRRPR